MSAAASDLPQFMHGGGRLVWNGMARREYQPAVVAPRAPELIDAGRGLGPRAEEQFCCAVTGPLS
jgi:hypothetical protein